MSQLVLVGSALIEDDGVAIARATLDAANRFINGIAPDNQTIQLN